MDPFNVYTGSESQSEPRIEWVAKARCRSNNPDDLFVSGAAQTRATAICRGCPVVAECLADALDHHMEFGIWGARWSETTPRWSPGPTSSPAGASAARPANCDFLCKSRSKDRPTVGFSSRSPGA